MTTRTCARCHREKSIRGVWYLTPLAHGAHEFVCESCYAGVALTLPALS
jgi:hypothetical protein